MSPDKTPRPGQPASTLDQIAKIAIQNPAVASEFFLPSTRAHWKGERYTCQDDPRPVIPEIAGVRFQEPNRQDPFRAKATQADLASVIQSLIVLRRTPELNGLVLSDEIRLGQEPGPAGVQRAIFGLRNPADGRFRNETDAARECHQQLLRAVQATGFTVAEPGQFDSKTGLQGLAEWAGRVRLRRRRGLSPWWLLALLPLLLLLLYWLLPSRHPSGLVATNTVPSGQMFGMPLTSRSFLILVDKSGSMTPFFDKVRAEAKRLLHDLLRQQHASGGNQEFFADVIVYDQDAYSAAGGLRPLSDGVVADLDRFLDQMQAGGGTELHRAIDLAGQEVTRHGRQTTLFILTDGEDTSIPPMVQDQDRIRRLFGAAGVVMHSTTPRLFDPAANRAPSNDWERNLEIFCQAFHGRFGPP